MIENTYYIETWGCQMNDLDTQRLAGQLRLRGFRPVSSDQDASLILLNTCSIREKSEHKVFSRLGELRELGTGGARIGVCGCVAQQEGEAILKRMPFVDFVIGPGNVGHLDEVLSGARRVAVDFPAYRQYDHLAVDRPSPTKALVTVIEGCNKNCTFCIVPTTRGREISRPFTEILKEVRHAVSTGRVEIELLGQTINAYRCSSSGNDFADLLGAVAGMEGIKRVRFVTSHPAEVTEKMIGVMRDHENISRYFHLPVQSGSTAVLRRMKRLYTRERYLDLIAHIKREIPRIVFSTDLIVGFPGETEEDFQQTLSLMNLVRFGSLFAFKYSPRPGTAALRIGPPVDDVTSTRRLRQLLDLQEKIQKATLNRYEGETVTVLYEGPSRHDANILSGRTDDNWTVNFKSHLALLPGTLVEVRVSSAQHYTLRGEALP